MSMGDVVSGEVGGWSGLAGGCTKDENKSKTPSFGMRHIKKMATSPATSVRKTMIRLRRFILLPCALA